MKIPYSIIVILIMAFIMFPADKINDDSKPLYEQNPYYNHQVEMYGIYPTEEANIVMLGNSITHGANWNELLQRDDVVERGVVADILEGFNARLKYILPLKPKVIFVMGGINDIYNYTPVEEIYKSYVKLLRRITDAGIIPVVQSTLHVASYYNDSKSQNSRVDELNEKLIKFTDENRIDFLDLRPVMSENGFLRPAYSIDGVHLTAAGYGAWGLTLREYMRAKGL